MILAFPSFFENNIGQFIEMVPRKVGYHPCLLFILFLVEIMWLWNKQHFQRERFEIKGRIGECHCTEIFHILKISGACLHIIPLTPLCVCCNTWVFKVRPGALLGVAYIYQYMANMAWVILASWFPSHQIGFLIECCGWMVLTPEELRKIKTNLGVLSWLVSYQCMVASTSLIFLQQILTKYQLCASLCMVTSWITTVNKTDTVLVTMEHVGHSV